MCGKNFYSSSALNKHIKRHGTKRLFQCDLCNKAFTVQVDLKAHVKFVHEKLGRDTGIPVFLPKSGAGFDRDAMPPNYAPIPEELSKPNDGSVMNEDLSGDYPVYEKPKPVLRMIAPAGEAESSAAATTPKMATRSSLNKKDNLEEDEKKRLKEIEDQREIEEWMISQGVSIGLLEQNPATVLRIPVLPAPVSSATDLAAPGFDPGDSSGVPVTPALVSSSAEDSSPCVAPTSTNSLPPLPTISSLVARKDKRKENNSCP